MNCKQVQEKIRQQNQTFDDSIIDHLSTCTNCQAWLDKKLLEEADVDDELTRIFTSVEVGIDLHSKISDRIFKKSKSNKSKLLLVATIAALICVPFAYGIIKELPLFSKAQEQYVSDETAEFLKELGVPVVESYFENEAYKLYVKDIYANYKGVHLKIAILDSQNVSPEDYHVELISKGFLGMPSITFYDLDQNQSWFTLTVDLPEDYQTVHMYPMEIRLVKGKVDLEAIRPDKLSNVVLSHMLQVDLSHLSKTEDLTLNIDHTLDSESFSVYLNELTVTSTGFYFNYELKNKIATTYSELQFSLSDDLGKLYHPTGCRESQDQYKVFYDKEIIHPDARELYLDVSGVKYAPITKVAEMTIYPIEFDYKGNSFTFKKADKSTPLVYELIASKALPSDAFPNLVAMKGIHSQFFTIKDYTGDSFLITDTLIANALEGDSAATIDIEVLADILATYVRSNYQVSLDNDNLVMKLIDKRNHPELTEVSIDIVPEIIDKIIYESTSALTQPFDLVIKDQPLLDCFKGEVLILPLK
ncbi:MULTISPECIES: hypothetical protein [unclassified Fusibacter]|uniref:hypothetical protein n=1 Tax=unclassified Fusibacter TaxID=2624464 RepID=UPI0010114D39|nr:MULTISPECIES: hypothetical protein [unclassified Fusibacter]MCK8060207.1 hypothetical protein [Fusibacter sp. A2]NPE22347.1 hypothetical protein [Fusibacter sp. A1]RXV61120.1 hypothetical protein DWB64_10910 [Fusibacter sp. A1]